MVNERITEDIVREHFKRDPFYNNIVLEEQISSVPKINKLLQNASKKGYGNGKPEFIIRIKGNKTFHFQWTEGSDGREEDSADYRHRPGH